MIEISHTQLFDLRQRAGWTLEFTAEKLGYTLRKYESLESPTGVNISPYVYFLMYEYVTNPLLKNQIDLSIAGNCDD